MSYPLVSYAKCSTLRAVKNFEDGAERLDKVLDRVAARMEARCNGVVDAIDRAITGLEQRAVKSSFLQPATSLTPAMTRNKLVNQRQAAARKNALRQHIIHQQKLNQGRAEAALKRTHAAKSAASVFSQAVAMKRASPSSAQQQQQRNNMVQQRTKSKEVTVPRPDYNTVNAGRTPKASTVRRVYGADRKTSKANKHAAAAKADAEEAAKEVVEEIQRRAGVNAAWRRMAVNRMGMQSTIEAQMIQMRARRNERASMMWDGVNCGSETETEEETESEEEETETESESESEEEETESETESETDLEFDDFSEEEEEAAVENWNTLVAARLAKVNVAKANWASLVDSKMAKSNANAGKWASLVNAKVAADSAKAGKWAALVDKKVAKSEANVGKWERLAAQMAGRVFFIGEMDNESDNESEYHGEREIYYIGGETDGVETDLDNAVGVLRGSEHGAETGIETEMDRWEQVDAESEDEAEEEEKGDEKKDIVSNSRWWW